MPRFSLSRRALLLSPGLAIGVARAGVQPTTYTYKTAGGCAIRADVHRKPGREVVPVIVWIHGGALIMGSRRWMNTAQLEQYIAAGFAVVAIDYRLAPETRLPDVLTDIEDAYRWIREQGPALFYIDPDRIAVVGHSAGGYLTLVTGYRCRPRPRALVAFYGYGDIAGEWYSRPDAYYSKQPAITAESAWAQVGRTPISETNTDRDNFYVYTRQHGLWPKLVAGLDPNTQSKSFDPYCPLRNVTREYPPTMLLHGDRDTDVPYRQSEMMAHELKSKGVECEMISVPNGGHGFDRAMDDPRIAAVFSRAVAFLRAHT